MSHKLNCGASACGFIKITITRKQQRHRRILRRTTAREPHQQRRHSAIGKPMAFPGKASPNAFDQEEGAGRSGGEVQAGAELLESSSAERDWECWGTTG